MTHSSIPPASSGFPPWSPPSWTCPENLYSLLGAATHSQVGGAIYRLPAENHDLRLGGSDLHPGHFTLS